MSAISWNSSSTSATVRPRSAASCAGSSSSRSIVACRSSPRSVTAKRNATLPVSGSTVIVGLTRRSAKIFRRSLARSSGVATSSWIARASFSASLAGVGVVIRSTLATSTFSRTSSCDARQTSEVLP